AARVAVVATVIVVACYAGAAIAFNQAVAHRLATEVDARLSTRAGDAARSTLHSTGAPQPPSDDDHDLDDAPVFVWRVDANGFPTALTVGAPTLGNQTWTSGAAAGVAGGSAFHFYAVRSGGGWFVAGESVAQIERTQGALVGPEVLFGIVLAAVAFVGSLIIGLRASAPLELIHRRQVEFTADASHELRTPLSVIHAEVDVALSRPRSAKEYQAVLRRVDDEGRRLGQTVGDLLWLARADDGHNVGQGEEETDVVALAASTTERFRPVAASREVTLRTDVDASDPARVRADPEWIDRLVGVLVDNACKYAGTTGQVVVSVRSAGGRVVLQVDDSGPGIPPEQRSLVFDRFHRGGDQPGGTGLGLAIADSVVRASNGTWHIGRAPLGGTRMEVSWRRIGTRRSDEPGRRAERTTGAGRTSALPTFLR
ncbi:MAG TPA: HAMP domain-containing sensor histidine kinase, partial [Acidimicrobiales bacterium]